MRHQTAALLLYVASALVGVRQDIVATDPYTDGGAVLRQAAVAARRAEPAVPSADQFVYVESIVSFGRYDAAGRYAGTVHGRSRIWLSANGAHDGWIDETFDRAAGRALPALNQRVAAPCDGPESVCVPAYRDDLPSDAAGMRAYLATAGPGQNCGDQRMFQWIAGVLKGQYVPPPALAAVFEVAASLPGLTVRPSAADPAGRAGVTIARTVGAARYELIFDSVTHDYLGARYVHQDGTGAPEEVIGAVARTRVAIVDHARQLPG